MPIENCGFENALYFMQELFNFVEINDMKLFVNSICNFRLNR